MEKSWQTIIMVPHTISFSLKLHLTFSLQMSHPLRWIVLSLVTNCSSIIIILSFLAHSSNISVAHWEPDEFQRDARFTLIFCLLQSFFRKWIIYTLFLQIFHDIWFSFFFFFAVISLSEFEALPSLYSLSKHLKAKPPTHSHGNSYLYFWYICMVSFVSLVDWSRI